MLQGRGPKRKRARARSGAPEARAGFVLEDAADLQWVVGSGSWMAGKGAARASPSKEALDVGAPLRSFRGQILFSRIPKGEGEREKKSMTEWQFTEPLIHVGRYLKKQKQNKQTNLKKPALLSRI